MAITRPEEDIVNKPAISKLNLSELISLSNRFDQRGMTKEADFCDKLASHIDKLGMARGVPDDIARLKEEAQDLKVNIPTNKEKDTNYIQLTDLIGDSQNNRITMASEELTRIPSFSVQKKGPKPAGIWYACGNEWISWLTYEMPEWIGDYVYSFEIDKSKVLLIETEEEFYRFEREYGIEDERWGKTIDWSKVATDYGGIEICPYQRSARHSSMWYYGWDVASGCIWDGSAVLEATLVAKRTGEIGDREHSPEGDEDPNWEWYGLGSGATSAGSSRDPEEIAEEVAERVGEGEESELNPTDPEGGTQESPAPKALEQMQQGFLDSLTEGEPWDKPWKDRPTTNTWTERSYHGGESDLFGIKQPSGAKTAKRIKTLNNFRGDAALYELSEPLDGNTFVVVSASEIPMSGPETYIFGANESGEIQDWRELQGSTPGIMCHNTALTNAGYNMEA